MQHQLQGNARNAPAETPLAEKDTVVVTAGSFIGEIGVIVEKSDTASFKVCLLGTVALQDYRKTKNLPAEKRRILTTKKEKEIKRFEKKELNRLISKAKQKVQLAKQAKHRQQVAAQRKKWRRQQRSLLEASDAGGRVEGEGDRKRRKAAGGGQCAPTSLTDHSRSVFVGRLDYSTSESALKEVFSQFGPVSTAVLVRNRDQGSRGYGFVEFERVSSEEHMEKVLRKVVLHMDGSCAFGRPIVVDRCRGHLQTWLPARLMGGLGKTRNMGDAKGDLVECSGRDLHVGSLQKPRGRLQRAQQRVRKDAEEMVHFDDVRLEIEPKNVFKWLLRIKLPVPSSGASGASGAASDSEFLVLQFLLMFPHYRYPANPPRLFSTHEVRHEYFSGLPWNSPQPHSAFSPSGLYPVYLPILKKKAQEHLQTNSSAIAMQHWTTGTTITDVLRQLKKTLTTATLPAATILAAGDAAEASCHSFQRQLDLKPFFASDGDSAKIHIVSSSTDDTLPDRPKNLLALLPDDVFGCSFLPFLSPGDISSIAATCKYVNKSASSGFFWRKRFQQKYPYSILASCSNWRFAFYLERLSCSRLTCYFSRSSFTSDVLGLCLSHTTRNKTGKVNCVYSSFDIISASAFLGGKVRRNAQGEEFTHFLPLYINEDHFLRGLPFLKNCIASLAALGNCGSSAGSSRYRRQKLWQHGIQFHPTMVLDVLPKLLTTLIVLLNDDGVKASDHVCRGFVYVHRLWLALCERYPVLQQEVESKIERFVVHEVWRKKPLKPGKKPPAPPPSDSDSSPASTPSSLPDQPSPMKTASSSRASKRNCTRNKRRVLQRKLARKSCRELGPCPDNQPFEAQTAEEPACPSLGDWLPLLLVSKQWRWEDVAPAYLNESFDRNVFWAACRFPNLASLSPSPAAPAAPVEEQGDTLPSPAAAEKVDSLGRRLSTLSMEGDLEEGSVSTAEHPDAEPFELTAAFCKQGRLSEGALAQLRPQFQQDDGPAATLDGGRVHKSFQAVGKGVSRFLVHFASEGGFCRSLVNTQGLSRAEALEAVKREYDRTLGVAPESLVTEFKKTVVNCLRCNSWPDYFSCLHIPCPAPRQLLWLLRSNVARSLQKQYHLPTTDFSALAGMARNNILMRGASFQRVVFVIDKSGSMMEDFSELNRPNRRTRLQFVAKQLEEVLRYGLEPATLFNLICFDNTASAWRDDFVINSEENIEDAIEEINSWQADGGTDMYAALKLAYSLKNVRTVVLLTDGMTYSRSDEIAPHCAAWSKGDFSVDQSGAEPEQLESQIPCHATSLFAPQEAKRLLQDLCEATGGEFTTKDSAEAFAEE